MKKLYFTGNWAERAMAFVQLELGLAGAYLVWVEPSFVLKVFFAHAAAFGLLFAWIFAFRMSGSRERREADQSQEERG